MEKTEQSLTEMATMLRVLCADMIENAGSGHPGMPMGMADAATVLFTNHLRFDPQNPQWAARDRFVLSAGHGSALIYALLHLIGLPEMGLEQLQTLRRKGSLTPGHPEHGHTTGIECTTGPLGQGFATSVGMAISEKKLRAELESDIASHRVFAIAGDGCLMEGISHEAAALAGHLQLDNLTVLFDDNSISIDGKISITSSEDVLSRFTSYGWNTIKVDGHSQQSVNQALLQAEDACRPTLIACKTKIGFGAPTKAGKAAIHGAPLGPDEVIGLRKLVGWESEPFHLPNRLLEMWREVGRRNANLHRDWQSRLSAENSEVRSRLKAIEQGELPALSTEAVKSLRAVALAQSDPQATRVSSKNALESIVPEMPSLTGGSADLSGSNGTRTDHHSDFSNENRSGNYIRYGVREHAMAAIMNGIALSGAYTPYGGTFLVFSDYCRPAIRLSALMRLRVIYVFTHDSIGLGEDGPTHQPVEHLASLRLIPGLQVLRPADAVEVAECWEMALNSDGPTALVLSRQNLPQFRVHADKNLSANGAYRVASCQEPADVRIFASGSEVHLAVEAGEHLMKEGVKTEVFSVPRLDRVARSDSVQSTHRTPPALQVAIEAGLPDPWRPIVGDEGLIFGVDRFGESASAEELFEQFGLTPAHVVARIQNHLNLKVQT